VTSPAPEGAGPAAPVIETERLLLRRFTLDDAEFVMRLVNEPSFLRYIGDKGVGNLEDARRYLRDGPLASYDRFGFGLLLVTTKAGGEPIGMCGLLKRDTLEDADIGYAFLPAAWSRGYATEAGEAVLAHGQRAFGLARVVAITTPDNAASIRVLTRLGFRFERPIRLGSATEDLSLYGRTLT
jgi:[ribosomal protein S5]-alanine N-acetyltransferase